jgi:hypothetical protein
MSPPKWLATASRMGFAERQSLMSRQIGLR